MTPEQVYAAEMHRLGICIRCHRKRYAEHLCFLEASRQHDEYGPPCRCPDAPRMRDAFEALVEMEQRFDIAAACRRIIERGTKPTCPEVNEIIAAWYARPGNEAGGEIHVELDDGNLKNRLLTTNVVNERLSEDARLISTVLLMLSPSQRRRV